MNKIPSEQWTKFDFLALVLIYASHADLRMTDPEVEWIKSQIGEDHFSNAKSLFDSQSDYQNIQSISLMKNRFFEGEDGTLDVQKYISSLFLADDDYSYLEDHMLRALKRIL